MGAMAAKSSTLPAKYVQVVEIDGADYHDLFSGHSPLNADSLGELIQAIIAAGPAALVVDIDTSDPSFKGMHLPGTDVPIVWAREASTYIGGQSAIIGMNDKLPRYWGYVDYQLGLDGYLVDFPRAIQGKPALHFEAVIAYCDSQPDPPRCKSGLTRSGPLMVSTRTGLQHLFAHDFLEVTKKGVAIKTGRNAAELLGGKMVFLGGSYSDSSYLQTYLEPKPILGVRLLALAAEAELEDKQFEVLGKVNTKIFEVILTLLMAALYCYLRPMPAMLTTLTVVMLAVAYLGYLAYLCHISVEVVPFILGIWLELMLRGGEDAEERRSPTHRIRQVRRKRV